jgi:hypothetical protein
MSSDVRGEIADGRDASMVRLNECQDELLVSSYCGPGEPSVGEEGKQGQENCRNVCRAVQMKFDYLVALLSSGLSVILWTRIERWLKR